MSKRLGAGTGMPKLLATYTDAVLAITGARFGVDRLQELRRPVFISGIPRSGTTVLSTILNLVINNSVADPAESFALEYLYDQSNQYFKESALAHLGGHTQQVDMLNFLIKRAERGSMDRMQLCRAYFSLAASFWQPVQLIDKTPSNLLFFEEIIAAFPDAVCLFCVRHPLQVYVSFKERLRGETTANRNSSLAWLQKSPEEFAEFYKYYCDKCFALMDKGHKILIVRYEDMCRESMTALEKVLLHMGYANAPEKLAGHRAAISAMFRPQHYDLDEMLDSVAGDQIYAIARDSISWLAYV